MTIHAFVAHIAVVWTLQPGEWTAHHPWEDGPDAREHAAVLIHDDALIIFAGSGYNPQLSPLSDAWRFETSDQSWHPLKVEGDLPPSAGSLRAAQVADDSWLLFGGYDGTFECSNTLTSLTLRDDLLILEELEQTNPPPPRALHAFAADRETHALITFGGVTQAGFLGDTWIAVPEGGVYQWKQIETPDTPSPRFGMSFGFDQGGGRLVVASGQTQGQAQMSMADDIWAFSCRDNEPRWSRIGEVPAGNSVRNPCFAWDQPRRCLWVWCGTPDARNNAPDLIRIGIAPETTVERIVRDDEPQRRSSGHGAVLADGSVWFGFGNHAGGTMRDWVVFNPEADE